MTAPSTDPARQLSLRSRLYRGETRLDVVGKRRIWYALSALVIVAGIISLGVRGFDLSIDFKGGDAFQFPANGHSVTQVEAVVASEHIVDPVVTKIGQDQIQVTTPVLSNSGSNDQAGTLAATLEKGLGLQAGKVSIQSVGSSWGSQITQKAIEGLVIFLIAVVFYIAVRFEAKMALAAIIALIHDLVITAGVYSLVGFSVSPSTIIALLTILGFSLYDTVVVFDRVRETTADLGPRSNLTYTTAANSAVNHTLMRSINTSLIALLPVAALLFVGAGLLGAGTLKDLALAQFVGLAAGAYSSIFIATPLLVQLKEREPGMKELQKRVAFLATHKPSALDATESPLAAGRGPTARTARTAPALPTPDLDLDDGAGSAEDPGDLEVELPARIPGSPMRQQGGRKKRPKGRPSGKRR